MRAFSEKNLISQEIRQKGFFEQLLTSQKVTLSLMLPRDIFFRAEILCQDITDLDEHPFKVDDLMDLLWMDFLDHARKYQNIKKTYQLLIEYDQGTPNVRLKKYYEDQSREIPLYPVRKKSDDVEHYYCRMKRKAALRGEVMLQDMAQVYPDHPFSLERVLEILIIDFIMKYRKGEAAKIILEKLYGE